MKKKIIIIIFFVIFILSIFFLLEIVKKNPKEQNANSPKLVSGMIPVYYDNENKVWKKADEDNRNKKWYNYDKGIWANAVIVRQNDESNKLSKSRQYYINSKEDTIILYEDILAFYVWIPRYKYQIFNKEFDKVEEQLIKIEFEKGIETTGTVTCEIDVSTKKEICKDNKYGSIINNESTYTHPAFTFGEDELTGLWVAKFETTGTADFPTILPNEVALTNNNVATSFTISQKFSSKEYINNNENVDAHMMKNIEWGAIAYLSQSKYGRCQNKNCEEIYQNNSMGITGRSSGYKAGSVKTTNEHYNLNNKENDYINLFGYYTFDDRIINYDGSIDKYTEKKLGTKASTTGNIYGIYDMSGGSNEYTMASLIYKDGSIISGKDEDNNSGFNGVLVNNNQILVKTNGDNLPNQKYYDIYPYSENNKDFSRSKLGDATGETRGWYDDYECLVSTSMPWSKRGCSSIGLEKAGLFYFCGVEGQALSHMTFRSVMIVK